jgi:hypothetical protein
MAKEKATDLLLLLLVIVVAVVEVGSVGVLYTGLVTEVVAVSVGMWKWRMMAKKQILVARCSKDPVNWKKEVVDHHPSMEEKCCCYMGCNTGFQVEKTVLVEQVPSSELTSVPVVVCITDSVVEPGEYGIEAGGLPLLNCAELVVHSATRNSLENKTAVEESLSEESLSVDLVVENPLDLDRKAVVHRNTNFCFH